ncbi:MAG: DUF3560 domain-containing protein [Proteobacteria bacterium]|nr:DUF3560 domain-containing protein [Pseudomonadota bacterium]
MDPNRINDQPDEDNPKGADRHEADRGRDGEDVVKPRLTYRERRERRAERRRSWAEDRTRKAGAAAEAARAATAGIPFGQPILAGHHSQRRHERALERADDKTRKAVEHSRMADHHEQAASTIESQLDASIYDDDPDAIDRLRERIEVREAKRERIKQFNRNRRKGSRDLAPLNEQEQKELADTARVAPYQLGPKGEAPRYWLSNLGANINRDRKRLARLEKRRD